MGRRDWLSLPSEETIRNDLIMTIEGILGRKLGMTQVFEPDGSAVPVTVIEALPCTVVQVKTNERDGYEAVQVGFGTRKRVNSPLKGHMGKLGQFRYLRELSVDDIGEWEVGKKVGCEIFEPGDIVDVSGATKGRVAAIACRPAVRRCASPPSRY